jgi:hypothetical protein
MVDGRRPPQSPPLPLARLLLFARVGTTPNFLIRTLLKRGDRRGKRGECREGREGNLTERIAPWSETR